MGEGVGHGVRDVLDERAAKRHVQKLLAAANAQHRHIAGHGAFGDGQFEGGAPVLGLDRLVAPGGAEQRRVDVEIAAGHNKAVDGVEVIADEAGLVGQRHRQAAGARDRPGVILAHRQPRKCRVMAGFLRIEGDADEGSFHGRTLGRVTWPGKRLP